MLRRVTRIDISALISAALVAALCLTCATSKPYALAKDASQDAEPLAVLEKNTIAEDQSAEDAEPIVVVESPCGEVEEPNAAVGTVSTQVTVPTLKASAHLQKLGWRKATKADDGILLGVVGESLRVEALRIRCPKSDLTGSIAYRVHVQGVGWQQYCKDGAVAGTVGAGRRMESITVKLTGGLGRKYDVWYRAYVQNVGWMAWSCNGQKAGTTGLGLRMEAVQITLHEKGESAPSSVGQNMRDSFLRMPKTSYRVMTGRSWRGWKSGSSVAGKANGPALRAMQATFTVATGMRLSYAVHLSRVGWTEYATSNTRLGSGSSSIEAVRMKVRGRAAGLVSVWYRAYVRNVGWTSWARDGKAAGSVGRGIVITAIQVKVLPKGGDSPQDTGDYVPYACITKKCPQLLKDASARQLGLVRAAQATPWPGPGLCAGWVEDVHRNAGLADVTGNANDLYYRYCKSPNVANLKVGMIVGVSTHTRTEAGRIWGHVGIYVGNGWVMHSVTKQVKKVPLSWWIDYYGTTVRPKWGWITRM